MLNIAIEYMSVYKLNIFSQVELFFYPNCIQNKHKAFGVYFLIRFERYIKRKRYS
jgi:hypothetical protein